MEKKGKNILTYFQSTSNDPQQLENLKNIEAKISYIQQQWETRFQQCIERWIEYYTVILKGLLANKSLRMECEEKYLQDMRQSILKAMHNMEKLYLNPQYGKRCKSKQNIKDNPQVSFTRQKTFSKKSRSNSYNSSGSKFSLFSPANKTRKIDHIKSSYNSNFFCSLLKSSQSQGFGKSSSSFYIPQKKLTKNNLQKPHYNQNNEATKRNQTKEQITIQSEIQPQQEKQEQEKLFSKTVEDYFQQKQSKLIEKELKSQMNERIDKIETNLNEKINTILETILEQKAKHKQKQSLPIVHQLSNQPLKEKDNNWSSFQNLKQNQQGVNVYQKISHPKQRSKGKETRFMLQQNKIASHEQEIENMIQNDDNLNLDKKENQGDKRMWEIQCKSREDTLQQFISISKKIKLPINETIISIYGWHYVNFCVSNSVNPQNQIRQLAHKYLDQQNSNNENWKKDITDCLNKLSKLLNLECKPEKQQKIKSYIKKCLSCFYLLILGEKYTPDQLSKDLSNCHTRL